jgi:hypothetical protein
MPTAPGFLTNHELDLFLGGGAAGQRQRLRLREDRLLPEPAHLGRVRRFNIALFPRFVLAGLVRDFASIPGATEAMDAVAGNALRSSAFKEVGVAVRESARPLSNWSFDMLVKGVVERAEDAVREWEQVVENAECELAERLSISFSTEFGVIESVANDIVIALDTGGSERVPSTRVVAAAERGGAVALERVNVLAKELGYVMPLEITSNDEDRELAGWFAKMTAPTTIPAVVAEAEITHHEVLPYRRSGPRRGRWHGASTMTRVPAAG